MCPLCIVLVLVRHEKKMDYYPEGVIIGKKIPNVSKAGFPYLFFINIIDLIN